MRRASQSVSNNTPAARITVLPAPHFTKRHRLYAKRRRHSMLARPPAAFPSRQSNFLPSFPTAVIPPSVPCCHPELPAVIPNPQPPFWGKPESPSYPVHPVNPCQNPPCHWNRCRWQARCCYCRRAQDVLCCWAEMPCSCRFSVASIAKWSKAPVCGTGDHGFESRCSPQLFHLALRPARTVSCACSSTDRALGFGPRGCGFESCQAHHCIDFSGP